MLPAVPNRKLAIASRTKTFILFAFVASLAVVAGVRFSASLQGTDFPDFYCAARMLAEGHGHQLYDADLQREYQARFAGRVGTLYIHPPFEAALYLSVAWLSMRYAYLLWSFLNLALLALAVRRLAKEALVPWDWRVLLAASLIFAPLLLCFLQGQDSVLLLLLVTLAFAFLRHDRAFAAGCWLALALFKFQIVLPLALVLVLTSGRSARGGLAKGFSLVALALAGLSAAISGWSVFTVYPRFLLHLQDQPFAGIMPRAMANFRGLIYFLFGSDQSYRAVVALSLCLAALIRTLTLWRNADFSSDEGSAASTRGEFDLAFANTVLFALLVSYHLNPHDLTLLLLPISLLLHHTLAHTPRPWHPADWTTTGLIAILFLPPIHLWTLRAGTYALISIPVLGLFLSSTFVRRQGRVH
jgi:hypothetical protein